MWVNCYNVYESAVPFGAFGVLQWAEADGQPCSSHRLHTGCRQAACNFEPCAGLTAASWLPSRRRLQDLRHWPRQGARCQISRGRGRRLCVLTCPLPMRSITAYTHAQCSRPLPHAPCSPPASLSCPQGEYALENYTVTKAVYQSLEPNQPWI